MSYIKPIEGEGGLKNFPKYLQKAMQGLFENRPKVGIKAKNNAKQRLGNTNFDQITCS